MVYRLADGSGSVALSRGKWDAIGDAFALEIARARRMLWLLFSAVFAVALTVGRFASDTLFGILILLGVYGGPLAIYFWYSHNVGRAAKSAEDRLKEYPSTPSIPTPVGKIPRAIRIASFMLVGPYLIIAGIGEIGGPDTFRNTPFKGANIGWIEVIALGLIAFQLLWPMLAPKLLRS